MTHSIFHKYHRVRWIFHFCFYQWKRDTFTLRQHTPHILWNIGKHSLFGLLLTKIINDAMIWCCYCGYRLTLCLLILIRYIKYTWSCVAKQHWFWRKKQIIKKSINPEASNQVNDLVSFLKLCQSYTHMSNTFGLNQGTEPQ